MFRRLHWKDSLVACDIGGTLVMKLLGFIEDQQAQLLDVSEDQLRMRIGRTRWQRWWRGPGGHAPLEIRLDIQRARDESLKPHQRTHATHSLIEVNVRPIGGGWTSGGFQIQAERVVHRLRWHLMAS